MEKQEARVSRRWRTVAVLASGVAIGIALVATPAASHIGSVTHLWNSHIRPKADDRYMNETAQTGDVMRGSFSARYVPHTPNPFFLVADSFPSRLKLNTPEPTLEYVDVSGGAPFTQNCPGMGRAATGILCVYGYNTENLSTGSPVTPSGGSSDNNRYFGFSLDVFPEDAAAPGWIIASWAYKVKAPSATPRAAMRSCRAGAGSCG